MLMMQLEEHYDLPGQFLGGRKPLHLRTEIPWPQVCDCQDGGAYYASCRSSLPRASKLDLLGSWGCVCDSAELVGLANLVNEVANVPIKTLEHLHLLGNAEYLLK